MKWIEFILIFFIIGCAKPVILNEFKPYVTYFEHIHNKQVDSNVTFVGSLGTNVLGQCDMMLNKVEISKEFWDIATEGQKRTLIEHELGHCMLKLQHINTYSDHCPMSYMNSYLMSDECYTERYGEDEFTYRAKRSGQSETYLVD